MLVVDSIDQHISARDGLYRRIHGAGLQDPDIYFQPAWAAVPARQGCVYDSGLHADAGRPECLEQPPDLAAAPGANGQVFGFSCYSQERLEPAAARDGVLRADGVDEPEFRVLPGAVRGAAVVTARWAAGVHVQLPIPVWEAVLGVFPGQRRVWIRAGCAVRGRGARGGCAAFF